MASADYEKALKMGQKKFRERTSRGKYPYLPVLDDILAQTDIETRTKLGTIDIPLELIVGTSTEGRTTSFASNFMPLLDDRTEFSVKWSNLCESMIAEGQRDAIIAFEFMGRYYVVEGNKRVSVSKYLGAVSVLGNVTRIVPKRSDDPENILYYEYLDFYNNTQINYVWFSQTGSYKKLLSHINTKEKTWSDDDRRYFRSAWLAFNKVFDALDGKKLPCTAADAYLTYIQIFGSSSLLDDSSAKIKNNMRRIWDEFLLIDKDNSIALLMTPNESTPKKSILEKLLSNDPEHLKVAFIHHKTAETSAWTYSHELGRAHLEQVFGDSITTCCFDDVEPGSDARNAIEHAINDGYDVIFTTTPEFMNDSLKMAVSHPKVRILNCSVNTPHRYIRTYYGRMYEAKFLCGVLAGILCQNDKIGYIADYPVYGMATNINAFAIGVKMTNPKAKIYLEWSKLKDHDPYQKFREEEIVIISNKEMVALNNKDRAFGLYAYKDGIKTNLALPIWHWGVFYEKIIQSILNGSWNLDDESDELQALNYWWGMSAGVIDHVYSDKIPGQTINLVELLKANICANKFVPFTGPLYDQEGVLRCKDGEILPPEDAIIMDWLLDNIIGRFPTIDEFIDDARNVIKYYGINNSEN